MAKTPRSDSPSDFSQYWRAEANNGRQPSGLVGTDVVNKSAQRGNAVPRPRGGSSPDQNISGKVGIRANDLKVGATYRVTAKMPAQMQEASCVQANGRVLPSTHSRSDSFYVQGVYDA